MANDIKIGASFDTASFRVVDSAIKSLITSVERLNRSMEGVSRSVSKIQTGGVQNGTGVQGIKTQQGKQPGIVGAILGTQDSSSVSRMVSDTDRAFDAVSRKISSFTSKALADMGRLNGATRGGGSWASRAMYEIEERNFARAGGVVNIPTGFLGGAETAPSGAPIFGVPGRTSGGRGGGGKGSVWGRIGSSGSLSSGAQGVIYGAASGMESLAGGNVGGFFGSTIGRLGIAGGAAYAGYRIADALTQMGANTYNANQLLQLENPVTIQQKLATAMSPFRGMVSSGIGKDYSSMLAWKRVFSNPEIMNSVTNTRLNQDSINRLMGDNTLTGMGKERLSSLSRFMSTTGLGIAEWAQGEGRAIPDAELKSAREVERRIKQEQLMADQGDRMKAAYSAELAKQDVFTSLMSNEIGQNFMGRFQTLASMGRTTSIVHRRGQPDITNYEDINARLMRGGWTMGEAASNYQSLLGIGKGYGSLLGGTSLVSAGMAGFGNIGQLVKTAGMIGGDLGGAGSYLSLINKKNGLTGGAGGLDVAVSRDLFGDISQRALGTGMYGGENLNWVSSNMAAMVFGGGADVAGQQRALYGFQMGNALNQTYTSGSRSNLDRAIANEAAMAAAGGFGGASRDLMRLANDPRLLASIAGGAKIPGWVDSSINKGMAQDFQSRLRAGKFADVIDRSWESDPVTSQLLSELRANKNDSNLVIGQHLATTGFKVNSKSWRRAEHFLAEKLGRALGSDNPQADISMIEEGYLGTLGLKPPRGPGAWRPGIKGLEAEAAGKSADIELAKGRAGAGPHVKEALGADPAQFAVAAAASMKNMGQMIVSFDAGVEVFKNAVNKFAGLVGYTPPQRAKGPEVTKIQ